MDRYQKFLLEGQLSSIEDEQPEMNNYQYDTSKISRFRADPDFINHCFEWFLSETQAVPPEEKEVVEEVRKIVWNLHLNTKNQATMYFCKIILYLCKKIFSLPDKDRAEFDPGR